jgi:hypothetical protein
VWSTPLMCADSILRIPMITINDAQTYPMRSRAGPAFASAIESLPSVQVRNEPGLGVPHAR